MPLRRCLTHSISVLALLLAMTATSCGGAQTTTTQAAVTATTAAAAASPATTATAAPTTTAAAPTTSLPTTTSPPPTTESPTTTTIPEWVDTAAKAALLDFLLASDEILDSWEIVGAEISGDWAGVIVGDGDLQIFPVLLRRAGSADASSGGTDEVGAEPGGWTIVEVAKVRTVAEWIERGVPEDVAAYLSACST